MQFSNEVYVFSAVSRALYVTVSTALFSGNALEADTKADIVVPVRQRTIRMVRGLGCLPMHGNGRSAMMATVAHLILAGAIPAVTDAPQIALLT